MAGKYPEISRIKRSIHSWSDAIFTPNGKWEGNNLHIDEIDGLGNIKRYQWVDVSFMLLEILSNQLEFNNKFSLFLHIDLTYSPEKMCLKKLTFNWLKENVSEFTPPSLNFTSHDYYKEFYERELVACKPDSIIKNSMNSPQSLDFFYRFYYDEEEEMYSREIYIFINHNGGK